jgi:hypothetical protein
MMAGHPAGAAAAFTGIMKESGMLAAMANTTVHAVPASMARHLPFLLGLASMPLSLLFDPDSFYLGALPIVAQVGSTLGVPPIQIAQAALLGQMTTGFPISPLTPATFLVVGLTGIELGEHQRFTGPYLFAASSDHDDRLRPAGSVSFMKTVRIGSGAGFAGDRIEPAVEARHARVTRLSGPRVPRRADDRAGAGGPRPGSVARVRPDARAPARGRSAGLSRARCHHRHQHGRGESGERRGAARELARRLGWHGLTIATVSGDDVYDVVRAGDFTIAETGAPVSTLKDRLISANAYIGAGADRAGAGRRRPAGDHRTCGRSVIVRRAAGL